MLGWVAQYMAATYETKIVVNTEFFTPEPDGKLMESLNTAETMGTAPRGTVITYLKQIELVDDKEDTEDLLKDMVLCNVCNDTGVERDNSGNVTGKKLGGKADGQEAASNAPKK